MIMNTTTGINTEKQLEECRFALSKISHEIRNPVTLVNSSLQLMETEHPELKQYGLWQDVMENMQLLRHLLDDLTSYNNTCKCKRTRTEMTPWLTKLADSIPALFAGKKLTYRVTIPENLSCASIDTIKLNQALTNLLRNAFEAASREVSFLACEKCGMLFLDISNDGEPVPSDQQKDIFTPFFTTKSNGTGLGLPIAKDILAAHDGNILLESSKETGTRFLVSLPLD
ncbi:MAG: HAMP domain-containing histidine kinase [Lachnospiraceae bacterium]|nr:HAMP domain-containing histidine kinase [Lachnospiraceae bacterium]